MMRFIEWSNVAFTPFGRRAPWLFYHRLANAGRLQLGPLILMWPLPWHSSVKHLPGYGYDRPSGVRSALGLPQPKGRTDK